jgi:hypothetical protein
MIWSHRYEKKRVRTGACGGLPGVGMSPCKRRKFFVVGKNYLLTGCPLMGDPVTFLVAGAGDNDVVENFDTEQTTCIGEATGKSKVVV